MLIVLGSPTQILNVNSSRANPSRNQHGIMGGKSIVDDMHSARIRANLRPKVTYMESQIDAKQPKTSAASRVAERGKSAAPVGLPQSAGPRQENHVIRPCYRPRDYFLGSGPVSRFVQTSELSSISAVFAAPSADRSSLSADRQACPDSHKSAVVSGMEISFVRPPPPGGGKALQCTLSDVA